ncbi:Lrp/AsnC family transcriptional regulator [Streptomyces coffeae]|uniref:AsnC family transcriptional regulator n=1 Tax=Streptomyces coffeae TaxID=621382 RepID=A0ABS1NC45_9ACTN|nr:AsnC family transcriptional regulator [Streptomyces coffeae]MBL1097663.1 AsnC family transcriptional regulator [Streptomyces coffeae]
MPEPQPSRLDEIDAQLLDLLQRDAERTLHELGERVGPSPSAVQRRIARFRKDGLITRQVAVLDPHRFGPTSWPRSW